MRGFFSRAASTLESSYRIANEALRKWFSHPVRAWASILGLALTISLAIYLLATPMLVRRVLFFPESKSGQTRSELHYVILRGEYAADVEELVKEAVLGPYSITLDRLFSRPTAIKSVILTDKALFIDFSKDILFPDNQMTNIPHVLDVFEKSIRLNFPSLPPFFFAVAGIPVKGTLSVGEGDVRKSEIKKEKTTQATQP